MKKFCSVISLSFLIVLLFVGCILLSCSREKEQISKPLNMEEIRSNFIENVKEEIKKSSINVDFHVDGTTLSMIDKSETSIGLMIIVEELKKQGVWTEDPNNTLGHFGSSLMKLGFTHFVSWGTKDKKIHKYELKKRNP